MTNFPPITPLPDWPDPDSVDFPNDIGPFTAALPDMVTEQNALAAWMQALAVLADGGIYQAQASTTDNTTGRLLKTGAYGLGNAIQLGAGDDLNALTITGFYYNSTAANVPGNNYPMTAAGSLLNIRRSSSNWTQTYIPYTPGDPRQFVRTYGSAGWSPWGEVAFQGLTPSFPSINLNGNPIGGGQITIADDAVGIFTPPRNGGFAHITVSGEADYPNKFGSMIIYYDVGGSLDIEVIWQTVSATGSVSTSDVTGTTGVDGELTVAVQAGVLKIENRLGAAKNIQITTC